MNTKKLAVITIAMVVMVAFCAFADDSRFVVSEPVTGEEIVADTISGLVWSKTGLSTCNWQEALSYCESRVYGGYDDWRLPNIQELTTLVNMNRTGLASDFPNIGYAYWSSTSSVAASIYAWVVSFVDGGEVQEYRKTMLTSAKCVRGGP